MKSIRDVALLASILTLIKERSYDILCDIVDAVLFDDTIQSVFDKWGIKLNVPVQRSETINAVSINTGGYNVVIPVGEYNRIIRHMLQGEKVEAIKAFRHVHNWGLLESKNFVEHLQTTFPK